MGVVLNEPVRMGLDDALEYIADDELIEVSSSPRLHCTYSHVPHEANCSPIMTFAPSYSPIMTFQLRSYTYPCCLGWSFMLRSFAGHTTEHPDTQESCHDEAQMTLPMHVNVHVMGGLDRHADSLTFVQAPMNVLT